MYATERHERILNEARTAGRVEVSAIATTLGVTTETVRRDLRVLEQRGAVRRVHGGAIPIERFTPESAVDVRAGRLTSQKRAIAARALDEIPVGGTIVLDAGTTTQALVELLPRETKLSVVTNSVSAAAALSTFPNVDLFVVGGRVRRLTGATVGQWTTNALATVSADVAFLGTNGFSVRHGMSTPDQAEATSKQAMIDCARRVVVVADSSKYGADQFHSFAPLHRVDVLISDRGLASDAATELADAGPEVVLA
ncbi:DeoR/GlpR family DNA-binding transcription regulator [Branchiibius sp. NY16-3462-2]|uniref:DeoR/GlpR family DNA-binding transcription regulator n=1 Tax=Branchiibius sp. NY16-3462-2 TaxID=1807500 RepID=UPI000799A0DD|nr:DeoR/GlpR family DNA-binding transcription regulator [Branchiibius sp. NY16-3462-2]KYH44334.1 D-beta-D-heptose 1-phosphate adenosyltransferase [Branchiibius sp. NY16-3462-2]